MAPPVRVRLSRQAGWRMPDNTIKVDRSTCWGNPFKVLSEGAGTTAADAVAMFRGLLADDEGGYANVDRNGNVGRVITRDDIRRELRGKNLACWCALDQPCHADVLLELANSPEAKEQA